MDPESRAMTKSITVMCDFMRDAATEVANAFLEEGFIPKDQHRKVLKDSGEVTSLWTSCLTARAKKKPEVLKKIMEIFLTRMPSSEYAVEELNQNYVDLGGDDLLAEIQAQLQKSTKKSRRLASSSQNQSRPEKKGITSRPPTANSVIRFLTEESFPAGRARQLGAFLDVPQGQLDTFAANHPNNAVGVLMDVITYWIDNDKPSWETLATALKACGHKTMAKKIRTNPDDSDEEPIQDWNQGSIQHVEKSSEKMHHRKTSIEKNKGPGRACGRWCTFMTICFGVAIALGCRYVMYQVNSYPEWDRDVPMAPYKPPVKKSVPPNEKPSTHPGHTSGSSINVPSPPPNEKPNIPLPDKDKHTNSECNEIKEEGPGVSLEETISKIDDKREKICRYLNISTDTCNNLKHGSDGLTPFNLAESYMQQNPIACWEKIVTMLCSKFKDKRLAKTTADAHGVNYNRHCP